MIQATTTLTRADIKVAEYRPRETDFEQEDQAPIPDLGDLPPRGNYPYAAGGVQLDGKAEEWHDPNW